MNKILNVYKPIGKTPLEMVQQIKATFPEYNDQPIGYAGRLDPLAHGVLLLMIGDATKDRDRYLHLNKGYRFEVIFGVETDTYDVLGLLQRKNYKTPPENVNTFVNSFVSEHVKKLRQSYPPFSSKTVQGKPLFWWAKQHKLDEIAIPSREIEVYAFAVQEITNISASSLKQRIRENISLIKGDFRQQETLVLWETFFAENNVPAYMSATFSISCSSGTYIRGLVHELGKALGCGAIAIDILRTKAGEYTLADSLRI